MKSSFAQEPESSRVLLSSGARPLPGTQQLSLTLSDTPAAFALALIQDRSPRNRRTPKRLDEVMSDTSSRRGSVLSSYVPLVTRQLLLVAEAEAATGSPEVAGKVCVKSSTTTYRGGDENATRRSAWHHEGTPPRGNTRNHRLPVLHQ